MSANKIAAVEKDIQGQAEKLAQARFQALLKEHNLQGEDLGITNGLDTMPSDGGFPSYTEIQNWPFEKRMEFKRDHKDQYDAAAQRFQMRGR